MHDSGSTSVGVQEAEDSRTVVITIREQFLNGAYADGVKIALKRICQEQMARGCQRFILDLSRVALMDSFALSMLIALNASGAHIVIAGANATIERLFFVTKLDRVFEVQPNVACALAVPLPDPEPEAPQPVQPPDSPVVQPQQSYGAIRPTQPYIGPTITPTGGFMEPASLPDTRVHAVSAVPAARPVAPRSTGTIAFWFRAKPTSRDFHFVETEDHALCGRPITDPVAQKKGDPPFRCSACLTRLSMEGRDSATGRWLSE